ncbi:MAG: cobyric acid synthase [Candidatus Puniceispirillum sp.]|nr:cobyric acid synthase [Candidatus Puniceispirillum sp.]MBT6567105.1 cobyric acid synthase [Candidatus Puniceispirillum sp.]
MIQGAGSNVGKSVLVAGLCRYFANQGLTVRPFKPQNMSNNAAATDDGGEIGRAQALQALACRVAPSVHMNPVLLKPETDTGAQIIVQGKRFGSMRAKEYGTHKATLLPRVMDSYDQLATSVDLVIVEGAGSPAEVNLRAGDIANMGFAQAANIPVILVGDIDRGGVIASLVGTEMVLDDMDSNLIKGFIINKFRGDTNLFSEGMKIIESHTKWDGVGILPWFSDARLLPAEDILDIESSHSAGKSDKALKIVVPVLRRIANFDDLDPLSAEPGIDLALVQAGDVIPADADVILLPGSKATISDLAFIRQQGWDADIIGHVRRGGRVLGLCGGYQMLGKWVHDPHAIEGKAGSAEGLGLLDVETFLADDKTVRHVTATTLDGGVPVSGYEIHVGRTQGKDRERPLLMIDGRPEGAISPSGLVAGSYVHGIFSSNEFRTSFMRQLGGTESQINYNDLVDEILDKLAAHIATHLDMDKIAKIAGLTKTP